MATYLFYDLETTGLNKAFDQILQFAAIRTTPDLQELDRYEFKITLNPDVVPSPYAMLTHEIGIHAALTGQPEYEAIKQIHALVNEPGTISVGYNTLGFDDEFLRFSFYRNLLPPYTHQYAQQCGRMDIYPMTILYFLYKNHVIQWPAQSLKLEQLNQVNHFVAGRAHDAMVDVEATLALARRFFEERDMWDYVSAYFNKQTDQARIAELDTPLQSEKGHHAEGLLIFGKYGLEKRFQGPVLQLGQHTTYKNVSLWLQLDSCDFASLTPDNVIEQTWVTRKKYGEPGFILPMKERFIGQLHPDRRALAESNKRWLTQNRTLFDQIIDYHTTLVYPDIKEADVDSQLYMNGFMSAEEDALCRQFHTRTLSEKAESIQRMRNPTLAALAVRLIGRQSLDALSPSHKSQFIEYINKVKDSTTPILDFKGEAKLTPAHAVQIIHELRQQQDLKPTHQQLLIDLEAYLKDKFGVY